MNTSMRKALQLTAVAATATTLIATTNGIASATPDHHHAKSGKEYFLISVAGDTETFVAHGLFTGGGKDDDSNDNYDVLYLGGGTLRINHPDAQSTFTDTVDPKTCFVTFKITGKYTLSNGTGRYTGATGRGKYSVFEEGILARDKDGSCSQTAEPVTQSGFINASGPATIR